jgi:hypothetical protein
VKIALEHHYSRAIAERLREDGYDVVAAVECGWEQVDDDTLLGLCETDQRVLATNNVADFAVIVQRWVEQGRSHAGLIFTSDMSLPRTRATIGKHIELLAALLLDEGGPHTWTDRVRWL